MQRHATTIPSDACQGTLAHGCVEAGEGRDCEASHQATRDVLLSRTGRPGVWLLVLAGVCSFVAVRALELGQFF